MKFPPGPLQSLPFCLLFPFAMALGHSSAVAAPPGWNLTTEVNGEGSVARYPDVSLYLDGSLVVVVPTPSENWHFVGWSGDTVTSQSVVALTMYADRLLTATFEIYTDTLAVSSVGNGHVVVSPSAPAYARGSSVRLTAMSDPGSHFVSWSGDTSSVANPLTLVMRDKTTVVATFAGNDPNVALPDGFISQEIVEGLDQPVGMAFLPDGRLLVVERQSAHIRMLVDGHMSSVDPVVAVDSVSSEGGERGLLGIATDPGWPDRPFVYVSYTALGQTIRLSRFEATGRLGDGTSDSLHIDPASRYDVLRDIQDLLEYHNAGGLQFGPDGMLYFTIGDDGDDCAAQDSISLKGVMLRLDVHSLPPGAGGPPDRELLVPADNPFAGSSVTDRRLIYAEGLRNPFSFDVDPVTGSVFIADVGYQTYEEIDLLSGQGRNFGWPLFEGPGQHIPECLEDFPHGVSTPPVYAYDRQNIAAAVISAGVYHRGSCASCSFPSEYEGDYFFADFFQGFIRRLKQVEGVWSLAPPAPGQPMAGNWGWGLRELGSFSVGPDGSLWYCRTSVEFSPGTGSIGRILHQGDFVGVAPGAPAAIAFAPPVPSPARNRVRFAFSLPASAPVDLAVFDVTGRRVRQLLHSAAHPAGTHEIAWDCRGEQGGRVAPGLYLARLASGLDATSRRVVVLR